MTKQWVVDCAVVCILSKLYNQIHLYIKIFIHGVSDWSNSHPKKETLHTDLYMYNMNSGRNSFKKTPILREQKKNPNHQEEDSFEVFFKLHFLYKNY